MATLPKSARASAKFQDFHVLEKMARGRLGKDLNAYVAGAFTEKAISKTFVTADMRDVAVTTRVAYALSLAEDIYGGRKQAVAFLQKHHAKLGATPLAKLETEWGGREVERLLQSIIHGLPA
jgi:Protein of unknown function (DUF2384)